MSRRWVAPALGAVLVAAAGLGSCRERVDLSRVEPTAAAAPRAAAPAEPAPEPPPVPSEPPAVEPPPSPDLAEAPPAQLAAYLAARPKSAVDLQPFRGSEVMPMDDGAGRAGQAALTDLNPRVHEWLLLALAWDDGRGDAVYHLENPAGRRRRVRLDPGFPHGVVLEEGGGRQPCELWSPGGGALAAAAGERRAFVNLCGGRLFLRNRVEGRKTTLEWATDFLRDNVWGGERITVFVRESLYQDAYLATGELVAADAAAAARGRPLGAPLRPRVDPRHQAAYLPRGELGLALAEPVPSGLLVGRWYPLRGATGAFVSLLRPDLVDRELAASLRGRLNPLDEVESSALVYAVAFDLEAFELGFAMGTDHPRLGWSERTPEGIRDARLPGPDGIDTAAPLIRSGMLDPAGRERVVATFTGGFKRSHGAFKSGELAARNGASHYGMIEHGAVLSKLQPGLATVLVRDDGGIEMLTWSDADDRRLGAVRHARQNGVPLVEPGPDGEPLPGALVPRWALGNWSGSVDQRLRALRAGVCLQDSEEGRFLIYAYFSSVTPSAMALVFAAYHCDYAMLTDMNALEHTYLAVYRRDGDRFLTQHLISEMSVLDRSEGGQELPRFVGFPDNRDFFYLLRRELP